MKNSVKDNFSTTFITQLNRARTIRDECDEEYVESSLLIL
jgi:hypothetical protein